VDIVTFTLAVTVAFFKDVAVIVTLPTAVGGAVYVVATPVVVVVGLNEPHVLAEFPGVQLHVTPAPVPVMVAVI
jgi:hypothetical protein